MLDINYEAPQQYLDCGKINPISVYSSVMSLLLDALGKAEADREQSQIPQLRTPVGRPQSPVWRVLKWLLLLCLIIASFVAGYFARPYLEQLTSPIASAPQIEKPVTTVAAPQASTPLVEEPKDVIELSAISYSEKPEIRFVMLNNSVMYEGDALSTGERIVKIERQGVVLEKDGKQKRIGLSRSQ